MPATIAGPGRGAHRGGLLQLDAKAEAGLSTRGLEADNAHDGVEIGEDEHFHERPERAGIDAHRARSWRSRR
jgi:hypothetical protein